MAQRIREFEQWQPSYNSAVVSIYVAGTSTLADVFKDEALNIPADNPQVLLSHTEDGLSYGKFAQPIYTNSSYQLDIDGGAQSGIQRPALTTLDGQDVSKSIVTAKGGTEAIALEDVLSRVVYATDYGELGDVTATNTNTLTAAIGAAAQNNGGYVVLPDGNFQFSQLNLPTGVVLLGQGKWATTLRSQANDKVVTLSGIGAGLSRLTLDGVDLQVNSVGLHSKALQETILQDCLIKRFETGVQTLGGRLGNWKSVSVESCDIGAKLHADSDVSNGANGDEYRNNLWDGGVIRYCTTSGISLSYEDKKCWFNTLQNIGFEDNAGTALQVNGARWSDVENCWFKGNTVNLDVTDDDDTDNETENTVIGLRLKGCSVDGGEIRMSGKCQDVIFDGTGLFGVEFSLTLPENPILLQNCVEDSEVTITGDGSKLIRWRNTGHGASAGITTDNTATKAWGMELEAGQVGYFTGKVIANQKDGASTGEYEFVVSAKRPGSELNYDTQTGDFTVGEIITGAVSGAQALIIADTDSGTSGKLTVRNIVGEFLNNEQVTDPLGGDALVNGALVSKDVELKGAVQLIRTREDVTGLAATFAANGPEIELQVTGEASKTYEWLCHVDAVVS